jgi:hypothetical protein
MPNSMIFIVVRMDFEEIEIDTAATRLVSFWISLTLAFIVVDRV